MQRGPRERLGALEQPPAGQVQVGVGGARAGNTAGMISCPTLLRHAPARKRHGLESMQLIAAHSCPRHAQAAHTYEAYKAEAADLPFPLSVRTEQRVLQGALQVLRHVTKNQRAALALLGNHQLEQEEGGAVAEAQKGMGLDELLQRCKQNWVVSQMEQLRAFITEYKDHDLIRQKTVDGAKRLQPLLAAPLVILMARALADGCSPAAALLCVRPPRVPDCALRRVSPCAQAGGWCCSSR